MVIVAVDDEKPARILLESTLRAVKPDAQIHMFSTPEDLLEYVENHSADIAVIEIMKTINIKKYNNLLYFIFIP